MEPITVTWQGREVRVKHDDERLTAYSPQAARIRSAIGLASSSHTRC